MLRLTNTVSQAGSAFLAEAITLANDASFSSFFVFEISDPVGASDADGVGADGLVFVVQTVSNTAGGSGGGIGYFGLNNSVGVEFDTWDNGANDGSNGNHVGIDINGDTNSVVRANISPRMNDGGNWYAWVDYEGVTNTLEVRLSQVNVRPAGATLSHVVDLAAVLGQTDAFVGFTSGTGAAGGKHDIRSWTFINEFQPIATGTITLTHVGPATNPVNTSHTVRATVTESGLAAAGSSVTFLVTSGPNAGTTGTGVSNASGQVNFTYTGSNGVGADVITASFTDQEGFPHSATVTKTWTNNPPVAEANGPYAGDEGASIAFTGAGSFDPDFGDSIVSYAWNFGDSGVGSGPTPAHTYADNGTYTVTLTVTDSFGATASDTALVAVADVAPFVVGVALDATDIDEGDSVTATGTFTGASVDSFTGTASWSDGGTSPVTITGFTFSTTRVIADDVPSWTASDNVTVTVKITDDDGSFDINISAPVTVHNVAPTIDSISVDAAAIDEGDSVTVSGTYSDPALGVVTELFGGVATWSDGVTTPIAAGAGAFITTRTFADDDPISGTASDGFTVEIKIADDATGSDTATSATVTVANVAPSIDSIAVDSATIDEGDSVTVSGTFSDPALGAATETFSGTAVWSDGETTPLTISGGTFETSRAFPDDHPATGTAADTFTVTVTIEDDDLGSDSATSPVVTVNNVAPSIAGVALSATSIDEGDPAVTVSGTFTDPALGESTETFTGTALWSDGATTPLTITGGTFETSRTFPDDDPLSGTASDNFTVTVTVTDDDGCGGGDSATSAVLTVHNVEPVLAPLADALVFNGDALTLPPATFTDVGVPDTHTATIDWGDSAVEAGTVTDSGGSGTVAGSHVYAGIGTNLVSVTVVDDDGGTAVVTFTVKVVPAFLRACLFGADDGSSLKLDEDSSANCDLISNGKVDLKKGSSVAGDVLATGKDVSVDEGATVDGGVTAADKVDLKKSATVGGSVVAGDDVHLHKDAAVAGDVTSADKVKIDAGASVGGIVTPFAAVPAVTELPFLSLTFTGGSSDVKVPKNGSLTLAPGVYGKLEVKDGATLTLSAGTYTFEKIDVDKDATIVIDASVGAVVIDVEKDVDLKEDVAVVLTGGTAADVLWQVAGGHVHLHKRVSFVGTVLATDGKITVDEDATVLGALFGESVHIKKSVTVIDAKALGLLVGLYVP